MMVGPSDGTMIDVRWPPVLHTRLIAQWRHIHVAEISVVQMSMRETCTGEVRVRKNSAPKIGPRPIRSPDHRSVHRCTRKISV